MFAVIREETPGGIRERALRGTVALADGGARRFPWMALGFSGALFLTLVFVILQMGGKTGKTDGA